MINSLQELKGMLFGVYNARTEEVEVYSVVHVNDKTHEVVGVLFEPQPKAQILHSQGFNLYEVNLSNRTFFKTYQEAVEYVGRQKKIEFAGKENKKGNLNAVFEALSSQS